MMTYVIAEPCVSTCDMACVSVCPVDAIGGPVTVRELEALPADKREERVHRLQMYIDPETCIFCGACEPECPVNAIFDEDAVPAEWEGYKELNRAWLHAR